MGISGGALDSESFAINHHRKAGSADCDGKTAQQDKHVIDTHVSHPRGYRKDKNCGENIADKGHTNESVTKDLRRINVSD